MADPQMRAFVASDEDGVIALISGVYAEYSFIFEPDGFDRDLREVPAHCAGGGLFLVAEQEGLIVGSVGAKALAADKACCELIRLYVSKTHRGTGLGRTLLGRALTWAHESRFRRMILWTDLRFERAHDFYLSAGFLDTGARRELQDINCSTEKQFARFLGPVHDSKEG